MGSLALVWSLLGLKHLRRANANVNVNASASASASANARTAGLSGLVLGNIESCTEEDQACDREVEQCLSQCHCICQKTGDKILNLMWIRTPFFTARFLSLGDGKGTDNAASQKANEYVYMLQQKGSGDGGGGGGERSSYSQTQPRPSCDERYNSSVIEVMCAMEQLGVSLEHEGKVEMRMDSLQLNRAGGGSGGSGGSVSSGGACSRGSGSNQSCMLPPPPTTTKTAAGAAVASDGGGDGAAALYKSAQLALKQTQLMQATLETICMTGSGSGSPRFDATVIGDCMNININTDMGMDTGAGGDSHSHSHSHSHTHSHSKNHSHCDGENSDDDGEDLDALLEMLDETDDIDIHSSILGDMMVSAMKGMPQSQQPQPQPQSKSGPLPSSSRTAIAV